MKKFSFCILLLGLLLFSACSASDPSETGLPSGSDDVWSQESEDTSQTERENILENQELEETDSETPAVAVSDRNENDEGSTPSASPGESGESIPAKQL